eukprot:7304554-Pyramimonas_sp.AAC.1
MALAKRTWPETNAGARTSRNTSARPRGPLRPGHRARQRRQEEHESYLQRRAGKWRRGRSGEVSAGGDGGGAPSSAAASPAAGGGGGSPEPALATTSPSR